MIVYFQIYTFGPTFRAENSNTSRHLAEFWVSVPFISFHPFVHPADMCMCAHVSLEVILGSVFSVVKVTA